MKRTLYILLMCMPIFASAQTFKVRWHNEASDTIRITELLKQASHIRFDNPSARVGWFGRQFIGTPYVGHTLEGDEEMLTVNLDELDCTTFVELALALAYTTGEDRQGWHDFLYNLRRIRYRKGELDGYSSRLHYICDWAVDNIHRGNITDVTRDIPGSRELVRSIDYMSENRDRYPSLADSAQYARIRDIENGYRNHKFFYIKSSDIGSKLIQKYLREGDILAFVSKLKNLDVTHMGMIVKGVDGELYVLHASSKDGMVEISQAPLARFLKNNPAWMGVRVFRLKE